VKDVALGLTWTPCCGGSQISNVFARGRHAVSFRHPVCCILQWSQIAHRDPRLFNLYKSSGCGLGLDIIVPLQDRDSEDGKTVYWHPVLWLLQVKLVIQSSSTCRTARWKKWYHTSVGVRLRTKACSPKWRKKNVFCVKKYRAVSWRWIGSSPQSQLQSSLLYHTLYQHVVHRRMHKYEFV